MSQEDTRAPGGVLRVLVVDDDPLLRTATRRMLRHLGHEAEACASADEALVRLADAPFDVLLTDEHMPGRSGTALARLVRERCPSTRVVLVSGGVDTGVSERPLGVDATLAKPFRLPALRALLARLGGEG